MTLALSGKTRARQVALITIGLAVSAVATFFALLGAPHSVDGAGNGSENCPGVGETRDGYGDNFTLEVSSQRVEAICIKSGTGMFGGSGHSGPIPDVAANPLTPDYDDGCYRVWITLDGHFVVVSRYGTPGPGCQALGHVDLIFDLASPTATPTNTPTRDPNEHADEHSYQHAHEHADEHADEHARRTRPTNTPTNTSHATRRRVHPRPRRQVR